MEDTQSRLLKICINTSKPSTRNRTLSGSGEAEMENVCIKMAQTPKKSLWHLKSLKFIKADMYPKQENNVSVFIPVYFWQENGEKKRGHILPLAYVILGALSCWMSMHGFVGRLGGTLTLSFVPRCFSPIRQLRENWRMVRLGLIDPSL